MKCLELTLPPLPQFITMGRGYWKPGHKHFERSFPLFDMICVVTGKLYMTENDIPYEIGPGGFLILEPGVSHYGYKESDVHTSMFWIHFHYPHRVRTLDSSEIEWNAVLEKKKSNDESPPCHPLYLPKHFQLDLPEVLPILNRMNEAHKSFTVSSSLHVHGTLLQLFIAIQGMLRRSMATPFENIAELTLNYLKTNMAEPFKAADMENALSYNYDYLSQCFKKYFGTTPRKYLQYLRMEESKTLLAETTMPIKKISETVGIPDYNYFVRFFTMAAGQTPKQYRLTTKRFD